MLSKDSKYSVINFVMDLVMVMSIAVFLNVSIQLLPDSKGTKAIKKYTISTEPLFDKLYGIKQDVSTVDLASKDSSITKVRIGAEPKEEKDYSAQIPISIRHSVYMIGEQNHLFVPGEQENSFDIVSLIKDTAMIRHFINGKETRYTKPDVFVHNDAFPYDITLVTVATVNDISSVVKFASSWKGPVCVCIYASASEKDMAIIRELVASAVLSSQVQILAFYSVFFNVVYPVNILKNLAISAVFTTHYVYADKTMLPSLGLYDRLRRMPLSVLYEPINVVVIPAFYGNDEIENKEQLIQCINEKKCYSLYPSLPEAWFKDYSSDVLQGMLCIDRKTVYYYMRRHNSYEHLYEESFLTRGYDDIEMSEYLRFGAYAFQLLTTDFFITHSTSLQTENEVCMRIEEIMSQYRNYLSVGAPNKLRKNGDCNENSMAPILKPLNDFFESDDVLRTPERGELKALYDSFTSRGFDRKVWDRHVQTVSEKREKRFRRMLHLTVGLKQSSAIATRCKNMQYMLRSFTTMKHSFIRCIGCISFDYGIPLVRYSQRGFATNAHQKYMRIDVKEKKVKQEKISKVLQMKDFSVALVGRTNVGKSTLFNRLIGRKEALVSRVEGTTRDRKDGKAHISGLEFDLIDTGGYVSQKKGLTLIEEQINKQTEYAVELADIVLFMLDGKVGVTNEDRAIASWLRTKRNLLKKPIHIVVNKTEGVFSHVDANGENVYWDDLRNEVMELGLGEPIGVSAEHGDGLLDLFDCLSPYGELVNLNKVSDIMKYKDSLLMREKEKHDYMIQTNIDPSIKDQDDEILQLTILGIPNSGKSTLLNSLLKSERFITGSIPGLTRDVVSTKVEYKGRKIRLVDTPGIPKADGVLPPSLNSLSIYHAHKQLEYSHVVALILDGSRLLSKHDLTLAKEAMDKGRGLFVILNKSDVMQSPSIAKKQLLDYMHRFIPQAGNVPSIVVSALYQRGLDAFYPTALSVFDKWRTRISTGILNRWLEAVTFRHPPPRTEEGKEVKLKYLTQAKTRPPSFILFSNVKGIDKTYLRYLTNCLRDEFALDGVPIKVYVKTSENPYTVSLGELIIRKNSSSREKK